MNPDAPAAASTPSPVTAATTTATAAVPDPSSLGFGHFIAQADAVGQTLLAVLLLMSLLSWMAVALKALGQGVQHRRSRRFLDRFWAAGSLQQVADELAARPDAAARDPFARLTHQVLQAQSHHDRHGPARLSEAGSASEFVTRTLKKALDEEATRRDSGMTLLATVGTTAPFVGLFGTVWGVYHALLAIGAADGPGSLSQVAGPVGEALIMTGLGLAVAIPAVMAYNVFTRRHRVQAGRLDAFAYELHTFVAMGQPMGSATGAPASTDAAGPIPEAAASLATSRADRSARAAAGHAGGPVAA